MLMKLKELKRFQYLKKKLFGKSKFAEFDASNPEHREYNRLAGKYLGYKVQKLKKVF